MNDYKRTLLMPETKFEMKANLATKEKKIQENWIFDKIEKKILAKNKSNPSFIIHDGPPYANGNIHVGHALNKILKDIILRYKSQVGFYTKFIPGWDTHGLPIEQALVNKDLANWKKMTISEKRKKCKEFAINNIYNQKSQFRQLGILSEMDEIYVTCDLDFIISQINIFYKMLLKGLIYQDLKPIYWSWSSQTALADAEIIYKDVESDSIYVCFNVLNSTKDKLVNKNDKLVIWTTTPYTLTSNLAVAVNPKFTYCKVKHDQQYYIVAKDLIENISKKFNWNEYEIVCEFNGKNLEFLTYKHPLYNKTCKVIVDDYVLISSGTGLVHNAPGFGHEDYLACKKYNIKPFCPIDNFGVFTKDVNDDEIANKFYMDVNPIIIERLKNNKTLLLHEKITHSVAHDWRTKKPVLFRATKQWFVNIEKIKSNILKALKNVKSIDKTILTKLKESVLKRPEWCISRQRVWGVPICIIYDKDFKPIIDKKLLNNIVNKLENEGVNTWYTDDVKSFLPKDYNMTKKYIKEIDIMDVWFDSGTSYSVVKKDKKSFPADLYFEGKDQFRGWFNSSLITSVAAFDTSPYKTLLTHGFVLDENGNKMSKSLGNVIDPLDVCKNYGADILRIWASSIDFIDDVKISKSILDQSAEIYRKIRNTLFRFPLGNLKDFNFKNLKKTKYSIADQYILFNLSQDLKSIKKAYDSYNFNTILKLVSKNIVDLSSWYFDYIKDSLYCDKKDSIKRHAIQSVLYNILETYLIALAPIIPHTCEEAYQHFEKPDKLKSVHLENFPKFKLDAKYKIDLNSWELFFKIKDAVYLEVEKSRADKKISSKSEAFITISSKHDLPFEINEIKDFLGVAKVEFIKKEKIELNIKVKNSKFIKCERCWNYFDKLEIKNNLCNRCVLVLKK